MVVRVSSPFRVPPALLKFSMRDPSLKDGINPTFLQRVSERLLTPPPFFPLHNSFIRTYLPFGPREKGGGGEGDLY